MSPFAIEHRAALGGKTPIQSTAVSLHPLPEGHVLHVMAASAESASAESFGALFGKGAAAMRPLSPGQWFIVGDEALPAQVMKDLAQRLKPVADIVDQSHGRVRIALSGAKALAVLSKGTAADLSLAAFPVGHAATALFGHIAVHLTRVSEQAFELMVLRGFAESLWDDLALSCAEYR